MVAGSLGGDGTCTGGGSRPGVLDWPCSWLFRGEVVGSLAGGGDDIDDDGFASGSCPGVLD